ncbi:MAG: type IX secretion system membrane protein PorP/SprF [Saprospiraceae bacterium]|nr:type IX secretion system membrane protein PorP/SprF [Saprospiraceae bacterium]
MLSLSAQQESHFTQYMHNHLMINPAYAGARGVGSFTAIYRKQWVDWEGAPETKLISFNSPFFGNKVGIGLSIMNQTIGFFDNWQGNLAYSYKLKLSPNAALRFGIHGLFRYYNIDFGSPNLRVRIENDPSIAQGLQQKDYYANVGAGIYLTVKDFFFGLSVPAIIQNKFGINTSVLNPAKEVPHFYSFIGTSINIGDKTQLKPSILLKYVQDTPFDFDANLSFVINSKFILGGSYRFGGDKNGIGESIDLLLMYQLSDRLAAGFSYDFTLSKIQSNTKGTFEGMLRFDLKNSANNMANPRFFF